MRVPLKVQIVAPLAAVTFVAIAALAAYQAWDAARQVDRRIGRQVAGVVATLSESSFPLTENVLAQMHDLSGAEFVVQRSAGGGAATLALSPQAQRLLGDAAATTHLAVDASASLAQLGAPLELDGESYYHARLPGNPRRPDDVVHLLYPRADHRQAIAAAAWPPVVLGSAAVAATALAGWWVAAGVGRAVGYVGEQLSQIAAGKFELRPPPVRDDELGDLQIGVNHTATQLAAYADQLRKSEQMRTLGQLAGGLAHEIRNAATGARLAVQHYQVERSLNDDADEPLAVANRQLRLIEEYVQRFLSLGRSGPTTIRDPVDVEALVDESIALAGPYSEHLGVMLEGSTHGVVTAAFLGDGAALRQAVDNLLLNAIDAAARGPEPREVGVSVSNDARDLTITVRDTGPGPAAAVADRMFEPLVSDKPDGAGLGLALVRQAAESHNGSVVWTRRDGRTEFTLTLPMGNEPPCRAS